MTTETTSAPAPRSIPMTAADEAAIRATIDDYYLGWFDADGDRMARALHPELAKRGWLRTRTGARDHRPRHARHDGDVRCRGPGPPRGCRRASYDVEVNDVYGDIAAAVVHAVPYVDYLHLVRTPDGWRILNALWCPA